MSLSIICLVIVAGFGYIWCLRGFYSALLNLACVLIAGAVAFGVWEPFGYALLDKGTNGDLLSSNAWGIALVLPFAVTLAVLRFVTDKLLRANVKVANTANYVGGGACGALAGVVTAGILILGMGMLRMDPSLFGYQAFDYGVGGSLKRENRLILPVDKIVARLYGHMSQNALYTDTPLAVWHPNLDDEPNLQRMNYSEGTSRNTIKPEECRIIGRYTLGEGSGLSSVLGDTFVPGNQQVADIDGESYPSDSHLEGFVLNFLSGAKEKNGQVIMGASQARLVSQRDDGTETIAAHPIAVVSRLDNPAKKNYGRFRYDSRELFIPSVGGDATTTMSFEFIVPKGYKPMALYIKGTRYDLPPAKPVQYASAAERDAAIKSGKLVSEQVDAWVGSIKDPIKTAGRQGLNERDPEYWGVHVSEGLPEAACIQDGTQGSEMEVSNRKIVNGRGRYDLKTAKQLRDVPKELQCRQFQAPERTTLVQVQVDREQKLSLLGSSVQSAERILPPLLVSTDGQQFEAIGYYYEDADKVLIRYTIGEPIRGLAELDRDGVAPTISRDSKLYLIFAPSKGVEIKTFNIGSKVIKEFPQPIKTTF